MAIKKYDFLFSEEEKEQMRNDYKNGLSIRDIAEKYQIKSNSWIQYKLLNGITRNLSTSFKLAHERYPERFKHSEETKQKMREIRLRYMKEHPESTAWRKRNKPSYPEECFIKFLKANKYDKKYLIEREKSIFPYYIDFAFIQPKVAIEIDGSQHVKDLERKKHDEDKDKILLANGWKVLRVTENLVKTNWNLLKKYIDDILNNDNIKYDKVGIFLTKKGYQKVERGEDGLSEKQRNFYYNCRKVKNRPSKEELFEMIKKLPFVKIAEKYNVSDKAIVKWCKLYGLPYRKKDIKLLVK